MLQRYEKEIKISVVMAVYNGEKYVRQALDTIINQSLKEIEIICVDDGSIDGTWKILNEYKEKDGRIRILRHTEKTDGAAAARNMGMDVAVGEYLSFLDADDFFELDMLEKAYVKAKADNSDVVLFDGYAYDEVSKRNYKVNWILNHNNLPDKDCFKPTECRNTLFRISMGAAWTAIFKRRMVTDNNLKFESIHHTDDQVFVYLSYCCANHISVLDERLVHYRKNIDGSQSNNASLHPESGYMAPMVLKEKLEEKNLYNIYRDALAVLALEDAYWHLCRIADINIFNILFEILKSRVFSELGTLNLTEKMVGADLIKWRDSVIQNQPEEYLLKQQIVNNNNSFVNNVPVEVEENAQIVIYGAGVFGKELFACIFETGIFKIQAWVDRNYKELGYPIQKVETILNIHYDYILVAVKYEQVYESIKNNLVGMGIDTSKIIWVNKV